MNEHILIPILAIVFVFSIPIIAIIHYYKQKKLEMDERTLMIEKGIMPPRKQPPWRISESAIELVKQLSGDTGHTPGDLLDWIIKNHKKIPKNIG